METETTPWPQFPNERKANVEETLASKEKKSKRAGSVTVRDLSRKVNHLRKVICDALRDLVPFVQFKECEKHPWRSVNVSKVAKTLRKLTLLHGCFSRFLNCTNGTKSRNAPHFRLTNERKNKRMKHVFYWLIEVFKTLTILF